MRYVSRFAPLSFNSQAIFQLGIPFFSVSTDNCERLKGGQLSFEIHTLTSVSRRIHIFPAPKIVNMPKSFSNLTCGPGAPFDWEFLDVERCGYELSDPIYLRTCPLIHPISASEKAPTPKSKSLFNLEGHPGRAPTRNSLTLKDVK